MFAYICGTDIQIKAELHSKRLRFNCSNPVLPLGTTVHIISMLLSKLSFFDRCILYGKNMLTHKRSGIIDNIFLLVIVEVVTMTIKSNCKTF